MLEWSSHQLLPDTRGIKPKPLPVSFESQRVTDAPFQETYIKWRASCSPDSHITSQRSRIFFPRLSCLAVEGGTDSICPPQLFFFPLYHFLLLLFFNTPKNQFSLFFLCTLTLYVTVWSSFAAVLQKEAVPRLGNKGSMQECLKWNRYY